MISSGVVQDSPARASCSERTADRLEGLEGVEVRLGMVEGGSLEKVQVVVEEEWSRNLR